jgi:hypothetical protein
MNALRIIIPAHNEERRIEPCLRDFCAHFSGRALVLVVANGCTDGTAALVTQLCEEYANLVLIDIPARIGKGGAVRAGLMTGAEEWVGFVDADHSFTAAEYDAMWRSAITRSAEAIIASRYIPGASVFPPPAPARRIASRVFNGLVRAVLGLPYSDTQCGAKLFRRDLFRRLAASLSLSNFAFDIDLLYAAHRAGARVVEYPITLTDRIGSTIRLVPTSLHMASALLRLRLEHSPIARAPYLDFLAADSVIPVRRKPIVLALTDDAAAAGELEAQAAAFADVEPAPLARSRTIPGRLAARARLLWWYTFGSHRKYVALVECVSRFPALLPLVSIKPLILAGDVTSLPPLARAIYARYRRVRHCPSREALLEALEAVCRRETSFEEDGDTWVLHYAGAQTNAIESIELR